VWSLISRLIRDSYSGYLWKTYKGFRGHLSQPAVLALLCASLTTFASTVVAQEGMFIPAGTMTSARVQHTATLLNDGRVLIAGGSNGSASALASAELYDPATGTFTATGNMTTARVQHTATLLNDGKVLIAGGYGAVNTAIGTAELYDPATGTFTATGSMTTAHVQHTATLLNGGKVLIAGGYGAVNTAIGTAELYDPATGTFTATGNMTTARAFQTATLLTNGQVLVPGGINNLAAYLASAELYNPTAGTFTATGNMTTTRGLQTANLLNNGQVLVAGGFISSPSATASAELYNPVTGTFTATGNMTTARDRDSTATLLNSGEVLIAGGDLGGYLASAELYDPATGAFTATGNMTTARADQTATLLNNGTVLIAGGYNGGYLASAELYEPVVVFPTSLSFSNQVAGTTSATQAVRLTNNQSTALSITSIAFSGTNASDFAETDNCIGSVAAGASCFINVTFAPAAAGSRSGSMNIANNLSGSPLPVPLTGTGVAATRIASLSASSLTLTSQIVGATSAAQGLTLNNAGNSALIISNLGISGTNASEFVETDNCGGSVAAGASCTISVTFSPTATGTRTGTLNITDNATSPQSPQSPQTVVLTGTGQDFSLAPISSASATVSAGQTASFTVAVSPAGGFNQSVAFTCTGAPSQSTCAVSPSSIALSGSAATTVTVTVTTMAASPPVVTPSPRGGYRPLSLITELLVLLLLTGLLSWQKSRRPRLAHALALLLFVCAGLMSACGSGSSGGGGTQRTPAGTYTVVVSGTFTSGSTRLAHNANLTLVVQ